MQSGAMTKLTPRMTFVSVRSLICERRPVRRHFNSFMQIAWFSVFPFKMESSKPVLLIPVILPKHLTKFSNMTVKMPPLVLPKGHICIERALGLQLSYDKCWVDLLTVSCFHAVLHIYWEHSWLNIAWLSSNTQCTGKETWKHMFPVSSVVKQSGCQLMNSLLNIFRRCTITISPMRQFTLWTFHAPSGQHSVRIWWKIWRL